MSRIPTERGIIFSAPMVRAIREGRKTVTRRCFDPARIHLHLPKPVYAEFGYIIPKPADRVTKAGRHPGCMYAAGAVVAQPKTSSKPMGMKPGEFSFDFDFARGPTHLANLGTRKVWQIDPTAMRLWVRETFSRDGANTVYPCTGVWYRADFTEYDDPTRPGNKPCLQHAEHQRQVAKRLATPMGDCLDCYRDEHGFKWTPAIYMPRALSRVLLDVRTVRLERLHEITLDEIKAEGVQLHVREDGPKACSLMLRLTGKHPPVNYLAPGVKGPALVDAVKAATVEQWYRAEFASLWDSINGDRKGYTWADNPWVQAISFRRV